jgi:hypothetical protein
MYRTLQNLQDSENKQEILLYGSIFGAATVCLYKRETRRASLKNKRVVGT